jgi:8-oxo-dGTP pyrophosphatase MutT (NUDIX family)
MASTSPVTPRLSAAIMLLRPGVAEGGLEVFMVRRHIQSDFAPDVFVFPGGSVNDGDREAEVTAGVCVPLDASNTETALGAGLRVAAIREMFEEAGVLLAIDDSGPMMIDPRRAQRLDSYRKLLQVGEISIAEIAAAEDIVLATDALIPCAHWITPEALPKRFDTYFFLALLPDGQSASHDERETTQGMWVQPATALTAYDDGQFPLVFATIHQLRELAAHSSPTAALDAWRGRTPPTIMPRIIERSGQQVILMPGEPES